MSEILETLFGSKARTRILRFFLLNPDKEYRVTEIAKKNMILSGAVRKEIKELKKIKFLTEFKIPVFYKEKELEVDFRCDLIIEECIIIELKSVSEINPMHEAQLLTYMKLLKAPKGILINFNCSNIFKEGQKTFVNEYFKQLAKI